jgi:hypothetical protein
MLRLIHLNKSHGAKLWAKSLAVEMRTPRVFPYSSWWDLVRWHCTIDPLPEYRSILETSAVHQFLYTKHVCDLSLVIKVWNCDWSSVTHLEQGLDPSDKTQNPEPRPGWPSIISQAAVLLFNLFMKCGATWLERTPTQEYTLYHCFFCFLFS